MFTYVAYSITTNIDELSKLSGEIHNLSPMLSKLSVHISYIIFKIFFYMYHKYKWLYQFHSVHPWQSAHCAVDVVPWSVLQTTAANGVVNFWRKTRLLITYQGQVYMCLLRSPTIVDHASGCPLYLKDFWSKP
jgi:hypothetical protein